MIYCSDSDKNPGREVSKSYFTLEGWKKFSVLSEKTEKCLATRLVLVRLGRRDDALYKAVSSRIGYSDGLGGYLIRKCTTLS